MRGFSALAVFVFVALLIRSTALARLSAGGIVIDILVFSTVVWALRYGASWGASFGFVIGLAADLDAVHWLGRHALMLSLIGYASGRLSGTLVRDSARTQTVLLLLATALHQAWLVAFEVGGLEGWPYVIRRVIVASFVSAFMGTLVLAAVRRVTGRSFLSHAAIEPRPSG